MNNSEDKNSKNDKQKDWPREKLDETADDRKDEKDEWPLETIEKEIGEDKK